MVLAPPPITFLHFLDVPVPQAKYYKHTYEAGGLPPPFYVACWDVGKLDCARSPTWPRSHLACLPRSGDDTNNPPHCTIPYSTHEIFSDQQPPGTILAFSCCTRWCRLWFYFWWKNSHNIHSIWVSARGARLVKWKEVSCWAVHLRVRFSRRLNFHVTSWSHADGLLMLFKTRGLSFSSLVLSWRRCGWRCWHSCRSSCSCFCWLLPQCHRTPLLVPLVVPVHVVMT